MRKLIPTVTFLLFLLANLMTRGQELYLNFSDGTNLTVDLVELRSITFTESVMNLHYLDNTTQSWDTGDISLMYYNENITNIAEHVAFDDMDLTVFPNPSIDGNLNIRYIAQKREHVNISILDVAGKVVKQLIDKEVPEGELNITWDAQGIQRAPFSGSTYFCRVQSDSRVATRKIVLF